MKDERGSAMAETVVFAALLAVLIGGFLFLGHRLIARQKLAAAVRFAAARAEVPGGGHRHGPSHGGEPRSVGALNRYLFEAGTTLREEDTTVDTRPNPLLGTKIVLENEAAVPPHTRPILGRDRLPVSESARLLLRQSP